MHKLLGACVIAAWAAGSTGPIEADVIGSDPIGVTVIAHRRGGDRTFNASYELSQTGTGPATLVSGDIPGMMFATIHQVVGPTDVMTFCLKPMSMSSMHRGGIFAGSQSMDLVVSGFSDNQVDPATGAVFAPAGIGSAEFNGSFGLGRRQHSIRIDAPNRNFQFTHTNPDPASGDFAMDFHLMVPRGAGMLGCADHLDFSMASAGPGLLIAPEQVPGSGPGSAGGGPGPGLGSGSETVPEAASLLIWSAIVPGGWLICRYRRSRCARSTP